MRERALRGQLVRSALVLLFAVLTAAYVIASDKPRNLFDLKVYYGALNHWLNEHGELYEFVLNHGRYGFTYPPFAALTMLPLAYLSWQGAQILYAALSLIAIGLLLLWLVVPLAQRQGIPCWFALSLSLCLLAAFEPLRETLSFGQINLFLVCLVTFDLIWLVPRQRAWAGIGVGLATAIKLTPAIFVLYLALSGRWRAVRMALLSACLATGLAWLVAAHESRVFWTEALWQTERIGRLAFISNQSLLGMLARLAPNAPSRAAWAALVLACLSIWFRRLRAAGALTDDLAGLALTGVIACLISPISWVHHLVWLLPALARLGEWALAPRDTRSQRAAALVLACLAYAILSSGVVWLWPKPTRSFVAFLAGNAYCWTSLALLCLLPLARATRAPSAPCEGIAPSNAPPGRTAHAM
jgi:alpha-1,2-mannosyltransferase